MNWFQTAGKSLVLASISPNAVSPDRSIFSYTSFARVKSSVSLSVNGISQLRDPFPHFAGQLLETRAQIAIFLPRGTGYGMSPFEVASKQNSFVSKDNDVSMP
jgi:hypothetical protein